jgi:hypothetical protein
MLFVAADKISEDSRCLMAQLHPGEQSHAGKDFTYNFTREWCSGCRIWRGVAAVLSSLWPAPANRRSKRSSNFSTSVCLSRLSTFYCPPYFRPWRCPSFLLIHLRPLPIPSFPPLRPVNLRLPQTSEPDLARLNGRVERHLPTPKIHPRHPEYYQNLIDRLNKATWKRNYADTTIDNLQGIIDKFSG